jgi:hypothetical protein
MVDADLGSLDQAGIMAWVTLNNWAGRLATAHNALSHCTDKGYLQSANNE